MEDSKKIAHSKVIHEIINQHRGLVEAADSVLELSSEMNGKKADQIREALDKFEVKLKEHLLYEREHLYDNLIKDFGEDDTDVEEKEAFIIEMNRIADVVASFLDKYKNTDSIRFDMDKFNKNFGRILGILMLRIEAEETAKHFSTSPVS